jgi:hypothetical protein
VIVAFSVSFVKENYYFFFLMLLGFPHVAFFL